MRANRPTKSGYMRVSVNGRLVMEHVLVWESTNGPIPAGNHVHHVNGDTLDNRIENLQAVDPLTHKRLHSGCRKDGEIWIKPCSVCGEYKPITEDHWYFIQRRGCGRYPQGTICRPCFVAKVVRQKQERARRRGQTERQAARSAVIQAAVARRAEVAEPWHATAAAIGWTGTANGLRTAVLSST